MENRRFLTTGAIILFSLVIGARAAVAKEDNLILNSSFENGAGVFGGSAGFDDWEISANPDNGKIECRVETGIVHSGTKAFRWRTEAPQPTSLSISYYSNYFAVNDANYIEAGYWAYLILLPNCDDVSIHFWDADNKYLGRIWGAREFAGVHFNQWNKVGFMWYPAALGSGRCYIPKGAVKARMQIFCNWHVSGVDERIDDDVFARKWDRQPTLAERLDTAVVTADKELTSPSFCAKLPGRTASVSTLLADLGPT